MKIFAVGNNHVCSRLCGNLGGVELCLHASGPKLAYASLSHIQKPLIQLLHQGNELCLRISVGIVRKQPVNV